MYGCNVCDISIVELVLTLVAMSSKRSNGAGPKWPTVLDKRELPCIMGVHDMLTDIQVKLGKDSEDFDVGNE